MRYFLIIIAIFAYFTNCEIYGQNTLSANDKGIFLSIPPKTNTDGLYIEYVASGKFGGAGNFIRIKPNVFKYEIPAFYEGKQIESLSLIIHSPHYEVQTFEFSNLAEQPPNIELNFKPLGTLPFSGKVLFPDKLNPEELQVKISYLPIWRCSYFKLSDCLTAPYPIASANLDKDGNFTVDLPDYLRDPVISSFISSPQDKGEFYFGVVEKSGKRLFGLKLKTTSEGFDEVVPSLSYPAQQVFVKAK